MHRPAFASIAFACLFLLACSGSSEGPDPEKPDEPKPLTEEQKIRRAQLASCGPMCERLVDCSVEELHEERTPEEVAKLGDLKVLVNKANEECNADCGSKTFSPRQIRVVQECVNGPQQCREFEECLQQAKRQD